ncbi:MAG: hypothetical protein ACK5PZ_09585, partial [Pirellula sp.]
MNLPGRTPYKASANSSFGPYNAFCLPTFCLPTLWLLSRYRDGTGKPQRMSITTLQERKDPAETL